MPLHVQPRCHFPVALERRAGVFLVNQAHQVQIEGGLTARLPVVCCLVQPNQLALATHAQLRMLGLNQCPFGFSRIGQLSFSATPIPL